MYRRLWLWAVVVALLGLGQPGSAEAREPASAKASKVAKRAKAARAKKAAKRAKAAMLRKQQRRKKLASARATSSSLRPAARKTNMPTGWTWPPSEAMQTEGSACLAELDRLGVHWEAAPAEHAINTPVVVADMTFAGLTVKRTRSKGPIVMDCALARALARDAAPALRSVDVTELHVGQIHRDRELLDRPGVLSRHSLGLAIDIYALVTRDGTEHVVETGYLAGDTVLHLAEILLGRSGAFRTLLTPGNDPGPHYNHFHLEARAFGDQVVSRLMRGASGEWCDLVDVLAHADGMQTSLRWLAVLCPRSASREPRGG